MFLAEKREEEKENKENTQRTEHKVMSKQRSAHTSAFSGERGGQLGVNINAASAVIAQQVIMITTCSLGSLSLI